jgi:osmotically inducible protein OsmC
MNSVLRKKNIKGEGITKTSNVTSGKDASDDYVLTMNMNITINGVEINVAKQIVDQAL